MKVSLNTIKQYTDFDLSVDELVAKINAQLGGVEEVTDLGKRYEDAVIVKVMECNDHPDADRLHVCMIDDGGRVEGVERDGDGLVQVVCGAPNVHAGIFAVWLPPKSTVPASYSEKELFVLDVRELRGVMSNGMLASAKELGVSDEHDGIVEIDPSEWKPSGIEIEAGVSFARAYGLDDTIIDIENKMFTHRPDLFGQLGVAREIAGILGKQSEYHDWFWKRQEFQLADLQDLKVFNNAAKRVPRFMAVALQGVTIKPSPLWLQCALVAMGGKSINNIVDATNYIMLLTAQPTHAYDYDKLRGNTLGVRMAEPGETASLLNGKTYELSAEDIVIVDGEGVVGLGGVMGGGNSEVSLETKNIVLEVATFDMYCVRKTSMRHGLFTDALTRFNKGQSPLQNDRVLAKLMTLITDVAGGQQASNVHDLSYVPKGQVEAQSLSGSLRIHPAFINERLGLSLSGDEIEQILRNVNFACYQDGDKGELNITAPFWRTDIELPEDVVEEVGRLYGFDKLPRVLPQRDVKPPSKNHLFTLKQTVRESLSRSGANEVLTYSFVHENVMKKAEQDVSQAFRLSNALSPDLQYYRLSVLPSLLDKVHPNIKSGHDEFVLFEIGKGHNKENIDQNGLPIETNLVELVYARKKAGTGAPYYVVQRVVRQLVSDLGIDFSLHAIEAPIEHPGAAMFDLSRSSLVKSNDVVVGIVGELKQSVIKQFKLPAYVAAATLDLHQLESQHSDTFSTYEPLPRFPKVTQDISLRVALDVAYQRVYSLVDTALDNSGKHQRSLTPISIYQPEGSSTKTITLRLTIASYEKTLTDKDVSEMLDVAAHAAVSIGAERI